MADIEFDTNELDKWEKKLLPIIRDTAPKELRKVVRQAANLLRKKARRNTPKGPFKKQAAGKIGTKKEHKPGDLRRSYRVWMKRGNIYEAEVGTNKFYAKMVEEGHVLKRSKKGPVLGFVPGKFYFRKAYEETEKEFPKHLKESIRRIGKEMGFDV